MRLRISRVALLGASFLAGEAAEPARAQDGEARLNSLSRQIQALQSELQHVKRDMAAHSQQFRALALQAERSQPAPALAVMPNIPPGYALVPAGAGSAPGTVVLVQAEIPEGPKLPMGAFRVGNVTITLGGFIEAAGIYRSRNEVADIASNFNAAIPFANSPNYHQSEFHFSARQSRFSALAQANPDADTLLTAYTELDWQGAAPTANSVESDSYNIRLRQAYLAYDRRDLGFYLMGGQAWSLLTMDKAGIPYLTPGVNIPLTIDPQYVPGFTWTRQPQLRVAKSFGGGFFTVAGSLENPQANFYTGPNGLAPSSIGTVNANNPGGNTYASTNNYSTDVGPDVILKASLDPGFGHFEAYGLARFIHDRVSQPGSGVNNAVIGGGGGAAALIHLIPKYVDIQASFLGGEGIGRYGSAQLPDAVVGANGAPVLLPEVEAMAGIVGHVTRMFDLYGYIGSEQESAKYFSATVKNKLTGYGYGSPLYNNSSCGTELGSSSNCVGNTSGIVQGTAGAWWKFVKGDYGTMQVGAQYSYTHRAVFQGIGPTPKTDENILLFSFRYYPFQ